jgi:Spy/CpxP family protein refolding chaperone
MRTLSIVPVMAALTLSGVAAASGIAAPADTSADTPDLEAPFLIAQGPGGPPPGAPGSAPYGPIFVMRAPGPGPDGPIVVMRGPGPGAWWRDSDVAKAIELSEAQSSRIEQTYMAHRLRLVDLRADLEKQELRLQPLLDVDQPDEAKVAAQIDLITTARGKLEKENALMLLAIRRVLSAEQWKRLQALEHERVKSGHGRPPIGPPGGPGPAPGPQPGPPLPR